MTRTWMTRRRFAWRSILLVGASFAALATGALAAPPDVPSGAADVDGVASEWADVPVFADMYRAAKADANHPVEARLKLRYDCRTATLYAYVEAVPGVTVRTDSPSDNFIKLGNSTKLVDAASGDDGTPPDFHYVGQSGDTALGWEASASLAPGTYANLNVHTQVNHDGSQTAAVLDRAIPMVLTCTGSLNASMDTTATFTRTYTWDIAKGAEIGAAASSADTVTATYTVTATKSAAVDTDFVLTGAVTATNPTATSVADVAFTVTRNGEACTITDPPAAGLTVGPGGSVTRHYVCTLPVGTTAGTAGEVLASVTFGSAGGAAGASANYAFTAPTTVVGDAADVLDAFDGGAPVVVPGGTGITATTVFTYTRDVAVPAEGCDTYPNEASVVPPGGTLPWDTASASVETCREAMRVAVDATTSFDREYDWTIAKTAEPATVTTSAATATVTYRVVATKSAPSDTGFRVAGTITATNPTTHDITGVNATATVNGTPCTVTGATDQTAVANSGAPAMFDFTCDVASAAPGEVAVTVTYGDTGGSVTTSAPFTFAEPTHVTGDAVDVLDAFNGGAPVVTEAGASITRTSTLVYARQVAVPAAGCIRVPNTATLTPPGVPLTVLASASASVEVCRTVPDNPPGEIQGETRAALAIRKSGPVRAKAGSVVRYTIRVRNTSTAPATSVVIRDILPSGYTLVGKVPGATLRAGRVIWTAKPLAPGATRTVTLRVRISRLASGTRCNVATASAGNAPTVRATACTRITRIAGAVRGGVTG